MLIHSNYSLKPTSYLVNKKQISTTGANKDLLASYITLLSLSGHRLNVAREQRNPVELNLLDDSTSLEHNPTDYDHLAAEDNLTIDDWRLLGEIMHLLKPLYDQTMRKQGWGRGDGHGRLWEVVTGIEYLLERLEDWKTFYDEATTETAAQAALQVVPGPLSLPLSQQVLLPPSTPSTHVGARSVRARASCLLSSMVVKSTRYSESREVISNAINKLGINLMKLLYQNTHEETSQHHQGTLLVLPRAEMLSQLTTVPTFAPQSTTLEASLIAIMRSLETLRCLQQLLSFIPGLAGLTLRTIRTLICNWAGPGRPKEVSETTTTIGIVMPLYLKRHTKYRNIKRATADDAGNEHDRYYRLELQNTHNVIQWWIDHQTAFPTLSRLALDIFAIPAMATDCERAFSLAKLSLTSQRQRMSPDTLEALQCLKNWSRYGNLSLGGVFLKPVE
ncbi:hypothetical protein V500_09809 [Pseudogymnoascus sp. VKM F-4518 (FW-2643)]|nr:hypothetical protein V500_09809 [Pseudogymnoascus sp. VKM F-4518 (FW-2643)]